MRRSPWPPSPRWRRDSRIHGERANDLRTAVAEACINAIEYGNRSAADIPVIVTLSADDRRLLVDVCDRALGATRPHMGAMVDSGSTPRWGPMPIWGCF